MRRAAPFRRKQTSILLGSPRSLVTAFALWLVVACSVYNNDLIGTTGGGANGGTDSSSAGHGGALAGSSSTAGGGNPGSVTPPLGGEGGEGGDPNGSQMAGAGGGGMPNVAGTAAVAGTAGSETGGTGGGSGSGGSGGGTPVNINLIDDFEDQNLTIRTVDTRGGVWYLFDNGTTGTTGPTPLSCCTPNTGAPAALGDYSLNITATGFTGDAASVGSGLGVDFRNQRKVYDASKFSGIRFWAKVGAGKNTKHRIQIADATTDKAGGKCDPAANAADGQKCDDHFSYAATFTTSWVQYSIPFADLTQVGWGLAGDALDTAHLYGLQITAAPGAKVDLSLDQIEFF